MKQVTLDTSKLLGLRLAAAGSVKLGSKTGSKVPAEVSPAMGAKIGSKVGTKAA